MRIVAGHLDLGVLLASCSGRDLTADDVRLLERAATVAALAITKDQAVSAVESKYRAEFLRDALVGRAGSPTDATAHAASLGWDIDRPMVVVVAETDEYDYRTSRDPDEVRFLMGFNRDVIGRRRDEMHALGVRVRWSGRAPRLWKSVIHELQVAEELTKDNDVLTLNMCVNYGGRAEVADTARSIARAVAAGRLDPEQVDVKTFARHLYVPDLAEADMLWRTSGENRLSNFMLWQAAYAELIFTDVLWPDCNRLELWKAIELYAQRDRRYGKA